MLKTACNQEVFGDAEQIFDLSLFVFVFPKSTEKGTEKPSAVLARELFFAIWFGVNCGIKLWQIIVYLKTWGFGCPFSGILYSNIS